MASLPKVLPKLPAKAQYLYINNAAKRNALSLSILRDLKSQLRKHTANLSLPPFDPSQVHTLPKTHPWLVNPAAWSSSFTSPISVLVLRSSGPVFSSGHDLSELRSLSHHDRKEIFDECAELMRLIRASPIPVVCAVQGLATAAGAQLALSADITIARAGTEFQLPGMTIGVPCTSPVTAVSRRIGPSAAYRMFATAEKVRARDLGGEVVDMVRDEEGEEGFERRVAETLERLVQMPGQPQAFGKWAFWTQAGMKGMGDGYEEAAGWAATVMAMHMDGGEAEEGVGAFLGKRKPVWST
ncbi:enoyl-CoA hydratase/isomerase, partial [Echria macrotheca]